MKKLIFTLSFILFAGCERNPVDRLVNPIFDGAVPQTSGIFVVFDDELKTGGGIQLIPGGENQSLNAQDRSLPQRSRIQFQYSWNGGNVTNFNVSPAVLQHAFAGMQLIVSPNSSTLSVTPARDLSTFGYTKMSFWIRGNLSQHNTVKIDGPSNGSLSASPASLTLTASQLTGDWQYFEISIPSSDFSSVKVFAGVTIIYIQPPRTTTPGQGGTIYLDDIRYVQ